MPESIYSTTSQIPRIPEPVVLAWTPDYDDGDVAYIAGSPPPPGPPPPSAASASTTSIATIRGDQLQSPPPPPASSAGATNGHSDHWASTISLAHATVGDGSASRRVSMIEERSVLGSVQEESPPDYVEALIPTCPVDYTFNTVEGDSHSMVVVPPLDVVDTRPRYHITVVHDLFDPTFFVTSIRKGGNSGHLVGDFRTKADCSALEETVYFKRSEDHIFKKIVAGTKKDEFQWKLQHKDGGLLLWRWEKWWTCRYVPTQTTSKNKHYDTIAQFYPAAMRTSSSSRRITKMTMEPAGQKYFDEILLSILILERKRKKIVTRRS
ncbi:hypothetical protein D9756_002663 [Leucocoprinus leucothites]|uniref:DUF6593 domain-containing protein n=1 Tax=Leucocoprinus leucothites TaxID=201217 RepID=A0A8H5LLY0_9AGAR|nr:hypothetical protein D9756_002663 [Leucoagaricus leucothites]